jgi:hypothetical protein
MHAEPASGLHRFQPLTDPRWGEFLQRHPRSSVFHTVEWLNALHRTYGYEPIGFTTSPSRADLQNAALFCRIDSWLTGRRLVSLPFSDHCDLLIDNANDLAAFPTVLLKTTHKENLRYIEIRPTSQFDTAGLGSHSSYSYCLHQIDLQPSLDRLFSNCHKGSTQRKIRRAEREGLVYLEGRDEFLLNSFYYLSLLTRRRHVVLPHPRTWFESLIDSFGSALKLRVAFKDKHPIAAILTLRHKDTLVYKYGCSDVRFHELGGVHLLFWRTIEEAKRDGLSVFDLGRSEWTHNGLITFKDRWGASRSELRYFRILNAGQPNGDFVPIEAHWTGRAAKTLLPHIPDRALQAAAGLIGKHVG